MIKLVLIIFIILVIAIFRIVRGIVKTVSNELPFWTEAAGKILNEFLEEENDSGHNPTANLKYRPSFETAFKRQMDQFARFIDQNCKTNLQTFQFLEFCISMHMAKADGVIDSSEIDGIRNYFKETYVEHLDETLLAKASPLVREYIQNYEPDELILSACLTLNVWYDILEDTFPDSEIRDELTMQIFSFVYQVAMMDGVIASSEERFFKGVCEFFKFPTDFQDHIKRTAEYQFNVRKNKANTENKEAKDFENALKLFQLTPNYTKEDLQKAWKNFAKLNHPDRFHNVDRELYEKINAQFLDAKNGYDLLLSKIENPTAKPYYEPSPSAAPSQEEQKQEPPKEEKKETYYSYSKEEFREPSEKVYTEPEKNPFLAYLGNLVSNIQNFVVTKFSPAQLKLIFWGNTKRKMVTIATPIVILLASILIPLLVESHYKKLLESDRVSDYNNAYRYFKVQGEASKDLMKELFRNSNNSILKTNTLHYLLEEKENSSDTHEFILEMLKKEDPIVIKNLEHLNGYYPWSDSIYNSTLELLKRKNEHLREVVAKMIQPRLKQLPIQNKNLEIFLGCIKDTSYTVSKFCWNGLEHYKEEDKVQKAILENLDSISPEIKDITHSMLWELLLREEGTDKLIEANKKYPLTAFILSSISSEENKVLTIFEKNPKFRKANYRAWLGILNKKSEDDIKQYLSSLDESVRREPSIRPLILKYEKEVETKMPEPDLVEPDSYLSEREENHNPDNSIRYARVNEPSGLFLRDKCSTNSSKIELIPNGERVEVLSKDREDYLYDVRSNWYKIRYQGKTGCSFGAFLSF